MGKKFTQNKLKLCSNYTQQSLKKDKYNSNDTEIYIQYSIIINVNENNTKIELYSQPRRALAAYGMHARRREGEKQGYQHTHESGKINTIKTLYERTKCLIFKSSCNRKDE